MGLISSLRSPDVSEFSGFFGIRRSRCVCIYMCVCVYIYIYVIDIYIYIYICMYIYIYIWSICEGKFVNEGGVELRGDIDFRFELLIRA